MSNKRNIRLLAGHFSPENKPCDKRRLRKIRQENKDTKDGLQTL
ncbi:hypothetical protein ACFLX3_03445 [Chloroflexota bacterium]